MLLGRIVHFLIHQRSKSDNKAFLLKRLKKYLNPHEIVIQKSWAYWSLAIFYMSPLLLHSNTNQYNINGLLCTYTEMFRIRTCCNHILSAAEGFWGRRQHARIQEFCQFNLILSLFYSLQRGSNGFIAEKTILVLYQGYRGGSIISRGGVSNLFQGGSKC